MFIGLFRKTSNIARSFSGLMSRQMCSDSHTATKAAKIADGSDDKPRERLIWIDCEVSNLRVRYMSVAQ